MGLVCSTFHWTPSEFFQSTPHEVYAVIEAEQRKADAIDGSK
jgi:hypothetical protein